MELETVDLSKLLDDPDIAKAEAEFTQAIQRAIAKRGKKKALSLLKPNGPDDSALVAHTEQRLDAFFRQFLKAQGEKLLRIVGEQYAKALERQNES